MARSGSSSKFVPVNLNSSYGQPHHHPSSNGSVVGLGRSRSFGGNSSSYGGMVSLNRSSRTPSTAAPTSTRASKLTVPRPVNLPSLRREHSGNDPTVALVGSSGSSGWTKQTVEDGIDTAASRSDGPKPDSSWGSRTTHGIDGSHRGAPGASTMGHGFAVEKAVVFRGEDFPTLQAAAIPYSPSPSPLPRPRSRGSQQNEARNEPESTPDMLQQHNAGDDFLLSRSSYEHQLQPAEANRIQVRGNLSDQANSGSIERSGGYARGPSPLIKLAHTSNWADDERETLSSVQMQDRVQSTWSEPNDGFHAAGSWLVGRSADGDFRSPSSRNGRIDGDSGSSFVAVYNKERGPYNGGRFEHDHRSEFDRSSSGVGKNEFLKRGWSFSAADSNARFRSPSYAMEREKDASGRMYYREGRDFRQETSGQDMFPRDLRPGSNFHTGAQGQDSKFGRDAFLGKQGFPGSGLVSSSSHSGRRQNFLYGGSDTILSGKSNIMRQDVVQVELKSERKAASYFGQAHHDDPFLGDGTSPSLYGSSPLDSRNSRMKKEILKDDLRDPARESFEAELERVEKMMEQERQRAAEERERAGEIARKEQEEQERIAREEDEMRRKLEEEAREAAYRAKREAEEAARKLEEARKAREEDKRIAGLEEERRKEAARRKLMELEERIAKRESMKRQEDAVQQERGSTVRPFVVDEVGAQTHDARSRNNEAGMDFTWKSQPSSSKVDPGDFESDSATARLPGDSTITFGPSQSSKEQKGFLTGARFSTWTREAFDQGSERLSAEKGKTQRLRDDGPLQEHERQERGPFRNSSFRSRKDATLADMQDLASFDDIEERSWWGRDAPSQSHYSTYPDAGEYPLVGRLRQSLPKQPKVLPPPPGQAVVRKHRTQPDDSNHEVSSSINGDFEEEAPSREDRVCTSGMEVVAHDPANEESRHSAVQASQQFDSSLSEEVVLSDAGSQFSDDTLEDEVPPTMQTYEEQELHSDIVSETYTEEEEEVDEMVDLTDAQESLEDHVLDRQAVRGEENWGDSLKQEKDDGFGVQDGDGGKGPEVANHEDEPNEEDKVFQEGRDGRKESESGCLIEDVAIDTGGSLTGEPTAEESIALKDGEPAIERSSEKGVEDQEIHHYIHPTLFLPVSMGDAGQVMQLEGASTRPTLVQQFQQPFSFMAMPLPLPQSGTLNHVVASPAMLPSMHGLSNQQDLPFHVQLGLLPGVPLMPNAIQIGSIQMPLHIHPQMPQLTHLHSQQAPVFQFGQISHSVPAPLPVATTQPAPQVHHMLGKSSSAQHQRNASMDLNTQSKDEDVASLPDVAAGKNLAGDLTMPTSESKTEIAASAVSKLDVSANPGGHKYSIGDKLEASEAGNGIQTDHSTRPSSRPSRGRRRSNVPRYHGILGRGQGRFHGGQNYAHQAPRVVAENWVEMGARGGMRGKVFWKSYRRTEYRVREPLHLDVATDEIPPAPRPHMEEHKGYRYVKKEGGSQPKATGDDNGRLSSTSLQRVRNVGEGDGKGDQSRQTTGKEEQPISGKEYSLTKQVSASLSSSSRAKGLLRKYEADTGEDAPFRTGVVRVFEQPGIETPNDKDDFIKVRSKRQLLRELREQREKDSKTKTLDTGVPEQVAKKQPKSSAKAGHGGMSEAGSSKASVRRRPVHTSDINSQNGTTGAVGGAAGSLGARNRTTKNVLKPARATPPSKDAMMETERFAHENRVSEHSTTAAWGGHRTNQEVVSLTQIQLEEAMKPSRLDAPFPEPLHVPEKAMVTSAPPSVAPVEKAVVPVKAASPLTSLLAGEKIQFGAVTSPTVLPSSNHLPSPMAVVRTGSPLSFRGDSPHVTGHSISYTGGYSEAHMAATFTSSKGTGSASGDDVFEAKVVDLEAEAEAAASAVAAAAISSDDSIESHLSTRGSVITADGQMKSSGLAEASPLSLQSQNISALDNPVAVALPPGLSAETPPSLFQGSSMTLSNSSGVVLQSLLSGAPAYSALEMGPLLGGPAVFSFGPREDGLASMEPGLSNWQQRHVGSPDSFYGAPPPYLSPSGLPSIQGHPHMLLYPNPFTPVGQFGQLGMSFMGTAYHPSDKQPDWTHVPMASSSLGPLAPIDGDLSGGASGVLTTQHLSGAASSISTHRMQVPGSSIMPLAAPSSLFDTGLGSPFQSHWSKAPAPPVHSSPNSESAPPMESMPTSRPAADLSTRGYMSRVFAHQPGHLPHSLGASNTFQQLVVMKPPVASCPLSSPVTLQQLPDELGPMEAMPTGSGLLNVAGGRPLSEPSLMNSSGEELISESQDQTRGQVSVDSHIKAVGRTTTPTLHTGSSPYAEQRVSKQGMSNGAEWSRSSQRKAASGRASALVDSRGGSMTPPSKLKQIYIAKPAADSRKLGAACT